MDFPCFLFDEHIARAIADGLRVRDPGMQVFTVGGPDAPKISTPDPDLLLWLQEHDCLLVTNNRKSMPGHLRDHLANGHHVPGIIVISKRLTWGEIIDQLHLIWMASLPGEFQDQIVFLPVAH